MKRLFLAVCFTGLVTPVFASPYFILRKGEGCYVKSYINKKFYDIDYKKFWGIKLLAQPHRKNNQFMMFRVDEQIYVTKTKCMERVEVEERFDDLVDSKPEEDYSRYNKIPEYRMENLQINDQRFMVEIDVGKTFFASKDPVFPDYSRLNYSENGESIEFDKNASSRSYKGGATFGLTFGVRWHELAFWTFKLKRYSGHKVDLVNTTVTTPPAPPVSAVLNWKYEDSFTSLLVGSKFLFLPNSHLRPSVGVHAGLCFVESKLTELSAQGTSERISGIKFRSTGLSIQLDAGLEYFFTRKFSLGANYGLEFLGTQKFRIVDSKDGTSDEGFISKMNYTNTFLTGSMKFYF